MDCSALGPAVLLSQASPATARASDIEFDTFCSAVRWSAGRGLQVCRGCWWRAQPRSRSDAPVRQPRRPRRRHCIGNAEARRDALLRSLQRGLLVSSALERDRRTLWIHGLSDLSIPVDPGVG